MQSRWKNTRKQKRPSFLRLKKDRPRKRDKDMKRLGKIFCSAGRALGGCQSPIVINKPDDIFMPETEVSIYPVYSITFKQMSNELDALGLKPMENYSDRPDNNVYFTEERAMREIAQYLTYERIPFPESERKDCDEYTIKGCADLRFYYGLMGLQMHGWYKESYHAFCGTRVNGGEWLFWEPNRAFVNSGKLFGMVNDYGYKPERWET